MPPAIAPRPIAPSIDPRGFASSAIGSSRESQDLARLAASAVDAVLYQRSMNESRSAIATDSLTCGVTESDRPSDDRTAAKRSSRDLQDEAIANLDAFQSPMWG
jgi:hypothetical protein